MGSGSVHEEAQHTITDTQANLGDRAEEVVADVLKAWPSQNGRKVQALRKNEATINAALEILITAARTSNKESTSMDTRALMDSERLASSQAARSLPSARGPLTSILYLQAQRLNKVSNYRYTTITRISHALLPEFSVAMLHESFIELQASDGLI